MVVSFNFELTPDGYVFFIVPHVFLLVLVLAVFKELLSLGFFLLLSF